MTQMDQALARLRDALVAAQAAFVKGNAEPFKALWSHGDEVTILGAFGGFEQGLGPRRAASGLGQLTISGRGQFLYKHVARTLPKIWYVWSISSGQKHGWEAAARGSSRSCEQPRSFEEKATNSALFIDMRTRFVPLRHLADDNSPETLLTGIGSD